MLEGTSQAELNEVCTFICLDQYYVDDEIVYAKERTFHDAFTELFAATGGTVGNRPPPIWKSCILVTISIFVSLLSCFYCYDQ